jgi:hypothetical protein
VVVDMNTPFVPALWFSCLSSILRFLQALPLSYICNPLHAACGFPPLTTLPCLSPCNCFSSAIRNALFGEYHGPQYRRGGPETRFTICSVTTPEVSFTVSRRYRPSRQFVVELDAGTQAGNGGI